ncbi:MAG: hypothetical protein GY822_04110 [Deltaproteobacteria bacterium]|nr:hypothetical protein [Deltaproteobacteria bacterium]
MMNRFPRLSTEVSFRAIQQIVVVTSLFVAVSAHSRELSNGSPIAVALQETQVSSPASSSQVEVKKSSASKSIHDEKMNLKADPISPFMEPHAQSVCDPCSMAMFCFNLSTNACDAYSSAAQRGQGMESLMGGVVFGGGGLMMGVMLGAAVGYVLGAVFVSGSLQFFTPQAIAAGSVLAVLFAIPFGVVFGGMGTVWGLQRGPEFFSFSSNVADEDERPKDNLPPPPGKQRVQAMAMSF